MYKILLPFLLLALSIQVTAQEETMEETSAPTLSLSGSVDAYFRNNFSGEFDEAPATSFANLPGFSLGMANLIGAIETDKVGMVADLVFGPRGADAVFGSTGSANIVNQLYAYWNVSDKTTITLGNFNTFLGYEVISPTANFNYSTSYMFSYGPFSHTGLKFDFALSDEWSLMLGVFNPTDATEFNPTNDYVGGAQLGYASGGTSAYLNTIISDGFFQIDLTAGTELSESLFLGVNATTNDDDKSGVAIAEGTSVIDFTLSANYSIDALTIIPEIRLDSFSEDNKDGLSSFVLAVVYGF